MDHWRASIVNKIHYFANDIHSKCIKYSYVYDSSYRIVKHIAQMEYISKIVDRMAFSKYKHEYMLFQ